MLNDLRIEALSQHCAACSQPLADTHLIYASYWVRDLRSFEKQVELGIIGSSARNVWVHVDCDKPLYKSWNMIPDLHTCIRCKKKLGDKDMVQPVFQVINARAVNPSDPTDIGIALGERVYLAHCNCSNPGLDKQSSNILIIP